MAVRKVLQPIADGNKKKQNAMDAYVEVARLDLRSLSHRPEHHDNTPPVQQPITTFLTTIMNHARPRV